MGSWEDEVDTDEDNDGEDRLSPGFKGDKTDRLFSFLMSDWLGLFPASLPASEGEGGGGGVGGADIVIIVDPSLNVYQYIPK